MIRKEGFSSWPAGIIKEKARDRIFPMLAGKHIENDCFLCEFVSGQKGQGPFQCMLCPMMDKDTSPESCLDGAYEPFRLACHAQDGDRAAELAEGIAGLPVSNPLYR